MSLFTQQQLDQIVSETIPAATDATHHNAIVGTVDATGAQVVASFTRDEGSAEWEIQAVARHDWSGDNEAGAKVILKW